jgi:hypothetical protein
LHVAGDEEEQMETTLRRLVVLLAFVAMVATTHGLMAQASRPAQPGQAAQQPARATGELVQVNTDAKTLVIKVADGTQMQFAYTDATEVTGADKGAAGLATMKGAQVIVTFTVEGSARTATKIEVRAAA